MNYKKIFGGDAPSLAKKTPAYWRDHVTKLAREKEAEVLSQAADYLAKVVAEHAEDTETYRFQCQRWGDFLSVHMQRLGRSHEISSGVQGRLPEKYASAINLKATQEIRLTHGSPADGEGQVFYTPMFTTDDGTGSGYWGGWDGSLEAPPDGHHYEVRAQFPYQPMRSKIAVKVPQLSGVTGGTGGAGSVVYAGSNGGAWVNPTVPHVTPFPRYAVDDQIVFAGIATTLYVPYGRGQEVYDTIMQEIRKGTDPYVSP